jgi:hypothetical protein
MFWTLVAGVWAARTVARLLNPGEHSVPTRIIHERVSDWHGRGMLVPWPENCTAAAYWQTVNQLVTWPGCADERRYLLDLFSSRYHWDACGQRFLFTWRHDGPRLSDYLLPPSALASQAEPTVPGRSTTEDDPEAQSQERNREYGRKLEQDFERRFSRMSPREQSIAALERELVRLRVEAWLSPSPGKQLQVEELTRTIRERLQSAAS